VTDPNEREDEEPFSIELAMDMPERAGKCAYMGGYVDDGETICHFGEEYVCRAPNFVSTGNAC
jgi:hypothetical protein